VLQSTFSIRNKRSRWTVPVLSARTFRFESRRFMYLRAPSLTLRLQIGLQLRPSKVGRPKGSRNKLPKARKTDKATSLSFETFQIHDTAINSHHRNSSSVDQAHPTNTASSTSFRIAEYPPSGGMSPSSYDKCHQVLTCYHACTQIVSLTPTYNGDISLPHHPGSTLVRGSWRPSLLFCARTSGQSAPV
jgi:hypothetical protein